MGYHGKRVYNLLIDNIEEANKYKKKEAKL
jgi:hypothetical protein